MTELQPTQLIKGRCHCGQVQFSIDYQNETAHLCFCSDCQMLSGSAFRITLPINARQISWHQGDLHHYVKTAASGNLRAQYFCPNCGTQIASSKHPSNWWSNLDDRQKDPPEIINLRLPCLESWQDLPTTTQQFQEQKPAWLCDLCCSQNGSMDSF